MSEKRDEVFIKFGPILLEGCLHIILDELNTLRTQHNLPPRTKLQFYDQIMNHTSTLKLYDWMEITDE